MFALMITDSAANRVMRSRLQKAAVRQIPMDITHQREGEVIPSLKQTTRIFCYHAAPFGSDELPGTAVTAVSGAFAFGGVPLCSVAARCNN